MWGENVSFFLYFSQILKPLTKISLIRLFEDNLLMCFFPHPETQKGNLCIEDFIKFVELLWDEEI